MLKGSVLMITAARGLGEDMLLKGFPALLGSEKVATSQAAASVTPHETESHSLVLLFGDVLLSERSHAISLARKIATSSSTKIAICDVSDNMLLHKLPSDLASVPYFKSELLMKFMNRDALLRVAMSHITIDRIGGLLVRRSPFCDFPEMIRRYRSTNLFPLPYALIEEPGFRVCNERRYFASMIANIHLTGHWRHDAAIRILLRNRARIAGYVRKLPRSIALLGQGHRSGISHRDYLDLVAKSIASVAPIGIGFNTNRYFEIPYAGALLVAQRTPLRIPHNFSDGVDALFFEGLVQLRSALEFIKLNPQDAAAISRRGHELATRFHTPRERARYVFETVNLVPSAGA